jgi:hypothetical protein
LPDDFLLVICGGVLSDEVLDNELEVDFCVVWIDASPCEIVVLDKKVNSANSGRYSPRKDLKKRGTLVSFNSHQILDLVHQLKAVREQLGELQLLEFRVVNFVLGVTDLPLEGRGRR